MKELMKQYNQEVLKKQMLVGGDVFFTTYREFEKGKVHLDELFIAKEYRSTEEVSKIVGVIVETFKKREVSLINITLLFNNPLLATLLSNLLEQGFSQSFVNEQGLILTKGGKG